MVLAIIVLAVICVVVGGCAGWAGKQVDKEIAKLSTQVNELEKKLAALEAKQKA